MRALVGPLLRARWRGELPLAVAFWGFGVLLGCVFIFFVDLFASDPLALSYGGDDALWVIVSMRFGHYLFSTVGIWRASARAIAQARTATPEATPVFAFLPRSWVVLGLAVPLTGLWYLK